MLLHKVQSLLLDICDCCGITMLLFILQVPLEQELHLLGGQLQMDCPLKQCFNALLFPQLDLLQPSMKRRLCYEICILSIGFRAYFHHIYRRLVQLCAATNGVPMHIQEQVAPSCAEPRQLECYCMGVDTTGLALGSFLAQKTEQCRRLQQISSKYRGRKLWTGKLLTWSRYWLHTSSLAG